MDRTWADGSSISGTTPTGSSPPSGRGRSTSESSGSGLLTRRAIRDLAARHDIRPRKSLGQHFLADPNLARAIVREAGIGSGDRVLEVGAGLGSLTLAILQAGAEVLAIELDRGLLPALLEVTGSAPGARVKHVDAMEADWGDLLGPGPWKMASNLPYNVAVPVVMELLERTEVDPLVIMVQREVGERLAAGPGEEAYGAVSLRVAYRSSARVVRRIPPAVFWPEPNIESVLLRLERRPPPVTVAFGDLFRLVDEGFHQRRKTMANALVRLGVPRERAVAAMEEVGLEPRVRAEELGLEDFARLAEVL